MVLTEPWVLPVPGRLGSYLSPRGGSNSWAQNGQNIAAWRRADSAGVSPVTLEFAPVLDCNSNCPVCPYRQSRSAASAQRWPGGEFARPNGQTVATVETVTAILRASFEAGVRGVLWTGGGEPTLFEPLAGMCRHASRLGLVNAVYTNGFLLGHKPRFSEDLMAPENGLVFLRISINALSPRAARISWGIEDAREIRFQLRALADLLSIREQVRASFQSAGRPLTSLQISTIVDGHNVGDLLWICQTVAHLFQTCRRTAGPEDVMVVRPVVIERASGYSCDEHRPEIIQEILSVCGPNGAGRVALQAAGVPLFLGFGLDSVASGAATTYAEVIKREYQERDHCWSHGLFLTVGPDATVYPCMELNCDPRWPLGNLKNQSVLEIYQSEPRKAFLEMAERIRWGPELFHPFSRTARLDRIAKAVIRGELSDSDIRFIREKSLTSPPLLLN